MKQLILALSMLSLSIASFAKEETKRNPSSVGNGLVMGMPARPDIACRRAVVLNAVKEAMEDSHHIMDCNVTNGVEMNTMNKQYTVHVDCIYVAAPGSHAMMQPEDFDYNVLVHATRATKNHPAGCKVDKVLPIETAAGAMPEEKSE